jgi:hypothetical protein
MKTIWAMALAAVAALSMTPEPPAATVASPAIAGPASNHADQQLAMSCPKVGEQTSGMNKICLYNCVGSMTAVTIGAAQLCPLSIQG